MKVEEYKMLFGKGKKNKYNNRKVTDEHGNNFQSKHELLVYQKLLKLYGWKNIIRQVSLPIGLQRIRPDFLVIESINDDGSFTARLVDAKGRPTPDWQFKANKVEEKHGIHIETLGKDWLK